MFRIPCKMKNDSFFLIKNYFKYSISYHFFSLFKTVADSRTAMQRKASIQIFVTLLCEIMELSVFILLFLPKVSSLLSALNYFCISQELFTCFETKLQVLTQTLFTNVNENFLKLFIYRVFQNDRQFQKAIIEKRNAIERYGLSHSSLITKGFFTSVFKISYEADQ